ncbi:MAG: insulinase family protein [Phycisphaerae bacterium]|nr:insulinase family protein [Phycisphaerae bacterium]
MVSPHLRPTLCITAIVLLSAGMPSAHAMAAPGPVGPRAEAAPPARPAHRDVVLDNGLRVIIVPVPDQTHVAIQAIHPVGFLDDPKGLPQGAHLLEHLLCMGAAGDQPAGAAFARLNASGLANAETLADFTHYDLVVPAADAEFALRAHADRLASLRIDEAIIAQEGPRAAGELAFLQGRPERPVFKFAVMAAHQSWRFGMTDARLMGGLDKTPADALRDLHARKYGPGDALVVMVGAIDPDAGEALARRVLGAIPVPAAVRPPPPPAIDWAAMPHTHRVTWDSTASSVIVAWAPPTDPADRAAASIACELVFGALTSDPALREVAAMTFGTNTMWPAGPPERGMPIFFCISLREGADADGAATLLKERVLALADRAFEGPMAGALAAMPAQFAQPPGAIVEMFAAQRRSGGAGRLGLDPKLLLIGNAALQIGMRARITGPDAAAWAKATAAAMPRVRETLRATLTPEAARVTVIVPRAAR